MYSTVLLSVAHCHSLSRLPLVNYLELESYENEHQHDLNALVLYLRPRLLVFLRFFAQLQNGMCFQTSVRTENKYIVEGLLHY